MSGEYLEFKIDFERHIFEKLSMAILFALTVFVINLLEGSRQRNILLFLCRIRGWYSGIMCNKPTHNLLDYEEYTQYMHELENKYGMLTNTKMFT